MLWPQPAPDSVAGSPPQLQSSGQCQPRGLVRGRCAPDALGVRRTQPDCLRAPRGVSRPLSAHTGDIVREVAAVVQGVDDQAVADACEQLGAARRVLVGDAPRLR